MEITTHRLILREFMDNDWPAVLAYQQDARYLRYYPWHYRTAADAQAFVQLFLAQQRESPRRRFQLAITLAAGGELIGNAGIRRKPDNDWEADIGYELAPDYWGHGYATEAAQALVNHGFRELGLARISSWCIADNAASSRVLERLGFQREGRLRRNQYYKGRWWDTLLYSLLREEWQKLGQFCAR